jgi:hypothetical protein
MSDKALTNRQRLMIALELETGLVIMTVSVLATNSPVFLVGIFCILVLTLVVCKLEGFWD